MTEQLKRTGWLDAAFWGELGLLLLAAPALYFPGRFPAWAPWAALVLLAAGPAWRRWRLGYWLVRTPADWPLFFLFVVMLPVSIWVAPPELRLEYSLPRAYILLWNFCLFWLVVVHSNRSAGLRAWLVAGFIGAGVLIALAGLFGTSWQYKAPGVSALLTRIPQFLVGRFAGAEEGFSPNQLAGSLLYVIPLALALGVGALRSKRWWTATALGMALAVMGLVFLLAQSRAGLVGLAAALAVLVLWPWRWGRWLLAGGAAVALAVLLVVPLDVLLLQNNSGGAPATGGSVEITIAGRAEIWNRALYGIQDFPYTGMGLGAFRKTVRLLYPLWLMPLNEDTAHAHNFFLQTALDFGLPGLVALLSIYLAALWQSAWLSAQTEMLSTARYWAVGFIAALLGQAVYGLADAVTMGAKPNLLFWWLLALIFGMTARKVLAPSAHSKMA